MSIVVLSSVQTTQIHGEEEVLSGQGTVAVVSIPFTMTVLGLWAYQETQPYMSVLRPHQNAQQSTRVTGIAPPCRPIAL